MDNTQTFADCMQTIADRIEMSADETQTTADLTQTIADGTQIVVILNKNFSGFAQVRYLSSHRFAVDNK